MTESLTHEASITINATPDEVYATVSDITRTGEWSPVCRECWWDEGDTARVGARFTGRNVTPDRTWETRCEVITAEPGRSFGWQVNAGYVRWIYTMQPVEENAQTLLTESWEFTPAGQAFFVERFGERAPEEIEQRRSTAISGIAETLAAMKRIIEPGGASA